MFPYFHLDLFDLSFYLEKIQRQNIDFKQSYEEIRFCVDITSSS